MDTSERPDTASIPFAPAPRETLQDHVYRRVKDLILGGQIEPGQTITIQKLATAFAVSHMPVREALQRLTAERALTVVAGRSVGVPPLSVERLDDLRRVRLDVEGLAVGWAAARLSAAALDRLDRLVAVMAEAVAGGDAKSYLRANRDFHFAIYRAGGSPTLLSIIETLWLQVSPYFNLLHASGNYAFANREHGNIVRALRARDVAAARAAMAADIDGAADVLRQLLAEEQPARPVAQG